MVIERLTYNCNAVCIQHRNLLTVTESPVIECNHLLALTILRIHCSVLPREAVLHTCKVIAANVIGVRDDAAR